MKAMIEEKLDAYNKETKVYNSLHKLEFSRNYNSIIKRKNCDSEKELADYLFKNLSKMDEIEMKEMVVKILSDQDIKKIILNFELMYYEEKPVKMSLEQFADKAFTILNRYQGKAGGFALEDAEWILYKNTDRQYEVMENEILFVNSLSQCDYEDTETRFFLQNIVKRLDSLSPNIKIDLRYHEEAKDKIIYILLWCVDKEKEGTKLGL